MPSADFGRIEEDFLVGLAKRSGDRRLTLVDPPAGEGDLAGMCAHMLAANGEDDAGLRPIGDRDQHTGVDRGSGAKLVQIAFQRRL